MFGIIDKIRHRHVDLSFSYSPILVGVIAEALSADKRTLYEIEKTLQGAEKDWKVISVGVDVDSISAALTCSLMHERTKERRTEVFRFTRFGTKPAGLVLWNIFCMSMGGCDKLPTYMTHRRNAGVRCREITQDQAEKLLHTTTMCKEYTVTLGTRQIQLGGGERVTVD